ncbi:CBM96 family carbohydrate-binding protein [Microbacterium sp. TL13]
MATLFVAVPAAEAAGPPLPAAGGHPRLIASADRMQQLSAQVAGDPVSAELAGWVTDSATSLLTAGKLKYNAADDGNMLDDAQMLGRRIQDLLLAKRITGDTRFLTRAWQEVSQAMALANWNPDHFLDTAEMTSALAVALDWGYDDWTTAQRTAITNAIVTKGLQPSLAVYRVADNTPGPYRNIGNWTGRADNVNVIVNSAMIMGALAVNGETTSSVPAEVYGEGMDSLTNGLRAYAAAGGFVEGQSYWAYATRHLASLANSLIITTGSDQGLLSGTGVRASGTFMLGTRMPNGQFATFADTLPTVDPAPAFAGLGFALQDTQLMSAAAQARSTRFASLTLLWRTPSLDAGSSEAPLDYEDPVTGVFAARGSHTDTDATFLSMRTASDPKLSHQHMDAGDFLLSAMGETWAVDLGRDEATYDLLNDKTNRWDYYRVGPQGHNTILINPQKGQIPQPGSPTTAVASGFSAESAFAVSDITNLYSADVQSWRRGARLFDQRTSVRIQDEIQTSRTTSILWSMHTGADVEIAADGKTAILYQNGKRLAATLVSPSNARFEVTAAQPWVTMPNPSQAANTNIRKLIVRTDLIGTATVAVDFAPLLPGETSSELPPTEAVVPLSAWAAAPASAELSGIDINGRALDTFRADTPSYRVPVTGPAVPQVTATASSGTVTVTQASGIPGSATVTVSGSGVAARTYRIDFFRAPIAIAGAKISASDGGRAEYTYDNDRGTSWYANRDRAVVTWDLGGLKLFKAGRFAWAPGDGTPVRYQIETTQDGKTWTTVKSLVHNGETQWDDAVLGGARWSTAVRLVLTGPGRLQEARLFEFDYGQDWFSAPTSVLSGASVTGVPGDMKVGDTATLSSALTWTGTPGTADSSYVSSDSSILSVDANGNVVARKAGVVRVGVSARFAGVVVSSSIQVTVDDPNRVRIYVSEDAYTDSVNSSTNYGSSWSLRVKGALATTAERVSYLKFDLSALAGKSVTSAVLSTSSVIQEAGTDPAVMRVDVHRATGSWSEGSVTWANRPVVGDLLGSFLSQRSQSVNTTDLTGFVKSFASSGAGVLSLGLTQDDAGKGALLVNVSSKESGDRAFIDVTLAPVTAPVPPGVLKSVAVSGVPAPMSLGSEVSPTIAVKDTMGRDFSGAEVSVVSSAPGVVEVSSSGSLKAVSPGQATVTVTAQAAGVVVSSTVAVTVVDPSPTSLRIYVSEDAYTDSVNSSTNYGSSWSLRVKGALATTAERVSYLKFDLSALAGKSVTSAVLSTSSVIQEAGTDPAVMRVDVHRATGSWSEGSVTWANRPVVGDLLGSFLSQRSQSVNTTDLTGFVKSFASSGAGVLSLGLTQDDAGKGALLVNVSSKESGDRAFIDVTLAPAGR